MKSSPFLVTLILAVHTTLKAEELSFSSVINYDDAHPSNIVAVVIGYQNMVKHKTGITIPVFSLEDGSGNGQERGVLFFVLAPTNYAGYIFYADCNKDSLSDAQTVPSEEVFPKDELHSFRLSDFPIEWMLKSHCYIDPRNQLSTGRLVRQRYLSSEQEATNYLVQLKAQLVSQKEERRLCKEIAAEEEKRLIAQGVHWYKNDNSETTRKYREYTGKAGRLGLRISEQNVAIKDAEEQLARLNKYQERRHE